MSSSKFPLTPALSPSVGKGEMIEEENISERAAVWLNHRASQPEVVLNPDSVISISPSSVETYLSCPRKFFYQSVLKLEERSISSQTAIGILVHRILEIFNRNFQKEYTCTRLKTLTQQLFRHEEEGPLLEALGFREGDTCRIKQLPELQRHYVEKEILRAFKDLENRGYFSIPFKNLLVEETLQMPLFLNSGRISLRGRADLIREREDGSLEIIDYKTSRYKYNFVRMESNIRPLVSALEPLDWEEPSHWLRYANREYQLPLYWLMLQSSPRFKGRRTDITVQLVRPASLSGKSGGCVTLTLFHDEVMRGMNNLMECLKRGIAEPLSSNSRFLPLGNRESDCKFCPYLYICEGPQEEENEEEFWEE